MRASDRGSTTARYCRSGAKLTEKNVGGCSRIARFVLGPVLIVVGAAALTGLFAIAVVALLAGLVLTVTAATQKCPLNRAIGPNTYRGTEDSGTTADGEARRAA